MVTGPLLTWIQKLAVQRFGLGHPAGTSIVSDICDLSNISDIAPLTLVSMEKSFFYHLFCVTQETYLSKDLWEIYIYVSLQLRMQNQRRKWHFCLISKTA